MASPAKTYDYSPSEHTMTQQEREVLRDMVNRAVDAIIRRVHQISGASDEDLYPDGKTPGRGKSPRSPTVLAQKLPG